MKQDNTIKSEWEDLGRVDDAYYRMRHKPCGTTVFVRGGQATICPKCQPDEWGASERPPEHMRKGHLKKSG